MFKLLSGLLLLGAVFGGAFYFGTRHHLSLQREATTLFKPALYPVGNRSFVVVIVGRNNGAFAEKTLQSVFSQNYLDFRIVYIDDASDDGSFELARDLIYESGQTMRVEIVQNETQLGSLASIANAIERLADQEIVVVVGGDDWLAHEWVLSRLNQYYANPDLWMTFGQYRQYPDYSLGHCQPFAKDVSLRQQPFFASHLKTFYVSLFRRIEPHDLNFATDFAYMAPMLEMAQGHSTFIPEILYIENRATLNREEIASASEQVVRTLRPYEPIGRLLP